MAGVVGVVATLEVKQGEEAAFEAVMQELAEKVRASEPGTLSYELCKADAPGTYVVLERYESQEAFQAHIGGPLLKEAGPKLAGCLAKPMQLQVLHQV